MLPPSVLVVDDDADAVETLADILREKSYHVATAYSGEAAVTEARRTRYDVILMDIVMPGLNGVRALKAIRALAPETSVIMMTAFTRHELVDEARRESAFEVLSKPLDVDRVLALLEQATQKRPREQRR